MENAGKPMFRILAGAGVKAKRIIFQPGSGVKDKTWLPWLLQSPKLPVVLALRSVMH